MAVAAVGGTTWATAGSSTSVGAVSAATTSASTGPSASPGTSASASPSTSASHSASPSTSASPGAAAVTVTVRNGPLGPYLVDGQGRSLYLFLADKNGQSSCNGACAAAWPPLTVSGNAQAGAGVTGNMLGTTTRSDGSKQVTYNKHPLYMFAQDHAAGETNGQGVNAFGALWWLVSPNGTAITATSSSSGSAPATSSGSASPGGAPGGPGY